MHPLGSVFLQKDRKTGQDGNAHRHRSSNSSLDVTRKSNLKWSLVTIVYKIELRGQ